MNNVGGEREEKKEEGKAENVESRRWKKEESRPNTGTFVAQ